jgi:hypothetical protein
MTTMPEPNTNQNPVIDRMQELVNQWEQAGDRRADFLICYHLMTSNMLAAIQAGEFHDPRWVEALLEHFAEYYFVALDDYELDSAGTPAVWRLTFDTATQDQVLVLQNLLLGINAHINYDLVLALVDMLDPEWTSLSPERRQVRYEDHRHVNDIIGRTVDSVQDQVVKPGLPAMRVVDALFGPMDEWMASRLISHWRESVWDAATRMLDCIVSEEREALRTDIEAEALRRARAILIGRDSAE